MIRRITLLAALLVLTICTSGFEGDDWVKVAPPNAGFSMLMPSAPSPETQSEDFPSGKVVTSIWLSKTSQGIYLASVTEYPEDIDVQKELVLDRDNFLKAVKAKLTSETDIQLKEQRGKEFIGTSETYTFKSRVYVVGRRRAYMIVAGEPTASFSAARASKFLQSFDLTQE